MGEIQRQLSDRQLFSFHVIDAPLLSVAASLLSSRSLRHVAGLHHAECLLQMEMGRSVFSPSRYRWNSLVLFAFWQSESHLDAFLKAPPHPVFERRAWHMRMRFYRQWGSFLGLENAHVFDEYAGNEGPVAAVTLARLKLSQTVRFTQLGAPVESQVRDHPGLVHGLVAFRPMNRFSTFTVWESEAAMRDMVRGTHDVDGAQHRRAMVERSRKPFHHEFTTMRFVPVSEHGVWPGRKRLTAAPARQS